MVVYVLLNDALVLLAIWSVLYLINSCVISIMGDHHCMFLHNRMLLLLVYELYGVHVTRQ